MLFGMRKKIIRTDASPTPVGPYSQAVKVGNLFFISGQVPINPISGKKVSGTIEDQTKQVLENIGNILKAEELSFENIVKVTVYIKKIADFPKMNKIYERCFNINPPARTTIQATLPGDFDLEIDAIAYI